MATVLGSSRRARAETAEASLCSSGRNPRTTISMAPIMTRNGATVTIGASVEASDADDRYPVPPRPTTES